MPNKFIEIDASSLRVSSNQTGNVAKSLDNLRSSLGDTSKDLLLSNLDQALADLNKERLTNRLKKIQALPTLDLQLDALNKIYKDNKLF